MSDEKWRIVVNDFLLFEERYCLYSDSPSSSSAKCHRHRDCLPLRQGSRRAIVLSNANSKRS